MQAESANDAFLKGHTVPIDVLSQRWADLAQMYTQKMFMRPLGVETMLVSIDDEKGPQIFKIDPSGHYLGYKVLSPPPNVQ